MRRNEGYTRAIAPAFEWPPADEEQTEKARRDLHTLAALAEQADMPLPADCPIGLFRDGGNDKGLFIRRPDQQDVLLLRRHQIKKFSGDEPPVPEINCLNAFIMGLTGSCKPMREFVSQGEKIDIMGVATLGGPEAYAFLPYRLRRTSSPTRAIIEADAWHSIPGLPAALSKDPPHISKKALASLFDRSQPHTGSRVCADVPDWENASGATLFIEFLSSTDLDESWTNNDTTVKNILNSDECAEAIRLLDLAYLQLKCEVAAYDEHREVLLKNRARRNQALRTFSIKALLGLSGVYMVDSAPDANLAPHAMLADTPSADAEVAPVPLNTPDPEGVSFGSSTQEPAEDLGGGRVQFPDGSLQDNPRTDHYGQAYTSREEWVNGTNPREVTKKEPPEPEKK